jgi:hypothetical protein
VVTKTLLEWALAPVNKLSKVKCYADSCEHLIDIPGSTEPVVDG